MNGCIGTPNGIVGITLKAPAARTTNASRKSAQQVANIVPAPLPNQVTTTKERTLPEPEIFYPTMVFNKTNILEMMPLTVKQPWLSPQSILGWPLLLDVDRPSFREWDKRIGVE
jgi:hypothetical protein